MEEWRNIPGFSGYQISNRGRIRTFRKKRHYPTGYGCYWYISDTPTIMSTSDDGNGYAKVMLYGDDGNRYCKKIHRLVAEAFIPHDAGDDTVDHIISGEEGKLNNSVENLRWIPRAENIRKAYRDGMCDGRIHASRKPVIVTDFWTGEEMYFDSIGDAAKFMGCDNSTVSHAMIDGNYAVSHYGVERADREDILLHGSEYY